MEYPTQADIKNMFSYDRLTGEITRRKRKGKTGCVATYKTCKYIEICIGRVRFKAHRLAWIYVNGTIPDTIDHIDGNGINNSISNLRNVTMSINQRNRKLNANNKSGVCGVIYSDRDRSWVASGKVDGKTKNIKQTKDFFEAVCARKSFEVKNNYTATHGRR